MDNIMKTLIVVLGISGVLALVVPSSVTVNPPGAQAESADAEAETGQRKIEKPQGPVPEEADEAEPDDDDGEEDYSDFGKPTMDAKPFDDLGSTDNGTSDQNSSGQNEPSFEDEGDDPSVRPAEVEAQPSRVPAGAPAPRHAGRPAP